MVFCKGHWVFWHWIVESFRHEHDVHTSGYHTSPGRWPFSGNLFSFYLPAFLTLYILPYHHMPYIQLPANTFHCEERLPQDRSNLLVLLSCKLISASRYSLNRLVLLMTLSASLYPQSFCKFQHNHKNYKRKVQSLNQRKSEKRKLRKWIFQMWRLFTSPLDRSCCFASQCRRHFWCILEHKRRQFHKSLSDLAQFDINLADMRWHTWVDPRRSDICQKYPRRLFLNTGRSPEAMEDNWFHRRRNTCVCLRSAPVSVHRRANSMRSFSPAKCLPGD